MHLISKVRNMIKPFLLATIVLGFCFVTTFAFEDMLPQLPSLPEKLIAVASLRWRLPDSPDEPRSLTLVLKGRDLNAELCREALLIQHVSAINAMNAKVTDEHIEVLSQFSDLRWFLLTGGGITDAGAEKLSNSGSLEIIYLDHTRVTDIGVARLRTLKRLRDLSLRQTEIRDAKSCEFRGFIALESLDCSETKIDDRICEEVIHMANLKKLSVAGTQVTDAGLKVLKRSQSLEELHIGRLPKLSIEGFREVIQCVKLRKLDLGRARVDDTWLDSIPAGSPIRELFLNSAEYSQEGLQSLSERNPGLTVSSIIPASSLRKKRRIGNGKDI